MTHEDLVIDGFYAVHHSDGIWYRIKLTIIKGTISGKLIDFGDFTQIRLDRIQPLWPQFRNLPSQAIHASLAGTASTLGTRFIFTKKANVAESFFDIFRV